MSLQVTIEILSNPELMKDIEEGRRTLKEGRTISWEKLFHEFNED
ncbi:MAG: hypothetical protein V2A61_05520 [Calditrichota bacterium]